MHDTDYYDHQNDELKTINSNWTTETVSFDEHRNIMNDQR